jgi:hypothetical protein
VSLPEHTYDIWHDRAVFHFLTDPADRAAYVQQVMKSVKPGGHVIVATFAPDGPDQCSGLPVARYAPGELHQEFGPSFELLEHMSEEHQTPWGSVQHFVYCHCLKPQRRLVHHQIGDAALATIKDDKQTTTMQIHQYMDKLHG